MAAHLSSHFLFLHYLKLRYQFNFNAFARIATYHNLHYKSTTPRTSTAFLLPLFRYHCPKLTPKEASHAKCRTKARTRS